MAVCERRQLFVVIHRNGRILRRKWERFVLRVVSPRRVCRCRNAHVRKYPFTERVTTHAHDNGDRTVTDPPGMLKRIATTYMQGGRLNNNTGEISSSKLGKTKKRKYTLWYFDDSFGLPSDERTAEIQCSINKRNTLWRCSSEPKRKFRPKISEFEKKNKCPVFLAVAAETQTYVTLYQQM